MKVLRVTRVRSGALAALVAAAVMSTGLWLQAQGPVPVLSPPIVVGPNVTFNWTPADGATAYTLQAGLSPDNYPVSLDVGNATTFSVQAPAVGIYYARVVPNVGLPSAPVPVVVASMFVPPAAPTNLTAYLNGAAVIFDWQPGSGGGTPTSMTLSAGSTPGASDIATVPLGPSAQLVVPVVPTGTYYVRVTAANPGGSATSNEVELVMPAGGGCSVPPARSFSVVSFGRYVQFDWAPVPGAMGYLFTFSDGVNAPLQVPVGANASRFVVPNAPFGNFTGTLTTAFACGQQTTGPVVPFVLDGSPPPGPRAPNPAPGQRLPLINRQGVIQQLAAERPDLLFQSCAEHGGNNRFMFESVRRLRAIDNRWGLNWKRGNFGDLSQDIVNYNFGSDSDEGTTDVYIIDIIGGHCGPRPNPTWIDQTDATRNAGTRGVWTLLPYINAGYPIVSDPQQ